MELFNRFPYLRLRLGHGSAAVCYNPRVAGDPVRIP